MYEDLKNKEAIQGYDPVAYFKGKPLKGNKEKVNLKAKP